MIMFAEVFFYGEATMKNMGDPHHTHIFEGLCVFFFALQHEDLFHYGKHTQTRTQHKRSFLFKCIQQINWD